MNEESLRESKLIRGNFDGIKILGDGELKHGLTIEAEKVSASAREKIEKAGGTMTLREARSTADGDGKGPSRLTGGSGEAAAQKRRKKPRPKSRAAKKAKAAEESAKS